VTAQGGFTYLSEIVPAWAALIEATPDPEVVTNPTLRAAIDQDHPDYELRVVVDSTADPAWEEVQECAITIPGGVTKTGATRNFTLPTAACQWLMQWREVCPSTKKGWVFPGIAGQPLSVRGAQTAISKLAEKVGIAGVSSHSFRRSALTAAHQAGLSLREVAEISGHRSLAALERYLDQDAAREKAEAARNLLVG
jgi:integrase/recombinase XerD